MTNVYEKIKTWLSNNRFFVGLGIGAILFIAGYLLSHRIAEPDNNIKGTLQRIADDNKQTGKAIDRASEHVSSATDELGRADEANRRAAFILSEDKERINTCAGIVNELQRNNSRAKQILADIERASKETD